jgi:hypothetical protein
LFERSSGGDQAEGGGDMGRRAETGGTIQAGFDFRRALGGNAAVTLGVNRGFIGKNRFNAKGGRFGAGRSFWKSVMISQAAAELLEKRIFSAVSEIGDADAGRVPPATGTATSDDRDLPTVAFRDEQGLVTEGIDGVDDEVVSLIEDLCGGGFVEKCGNHFDLSAGMDGARALGHRVGFLATDLAVHRVELAIDVGDADFVEIDERQVANAGSGERFDRPRSHSADADHGDTGSQKPVERRLAIKPSDAAKAKWCGVRHGGNMDSDRWESLQKFRRWAGSRGTPRSGTGQR